MSGAVICQECRLRGGGIAVPIDRGVTALTSSLSDQREWRWGLSSPIAHGSVVFAAWPVVQSRLDPGLSRTRRTLIGCTMLVGLGAPDADLALGLLYPTQAVSNYHNGPTHSLLIALVFAVPFALVCRAIVRLPWTFLGITGAALYASHVIVDWLTWGRGVQMFWPITDTRFNAPFPLLMGVRHSVGAPATTHLLTVANDLAFGLAVWWVSRWSWSRWTKSKNRNSPLGPADQG